VGHLAAVVADLESRMRAAAAARLGDETRATELAIADDPLARQGTWRSPRGGLPRRASLLPLPVLHGERVGVRGGNGHPPRLLPPLTLALSPPAGEETGSRIARDYEPVQPTYGQSTVKATCGPAPC
jgi:excinuclease ABC subunit B